MHTARQLKEEQFAISIDGRDASRADLIPDWSTLDRFGIVMHEPYGAIGASHLIQLMITAFYDARPKRRDRSTPVYPEIYIFHVGGRFGDFANFDFFPSRKEVFVDNAPTDILNAINDRGITRLAVPDRPYELAQFDWKEPAQALDRISSAWTYSASGRVQDADVAISAESKVVEANTKITLHPKESYMERQKAAEAIGAIVIPDNERFSALVMREGEVDEATCDRIRDARADLDDERGRTETYRRIDGSEALGRLHVGSVPAFEANPSMDELFAGDAPAA